MEAASKSMPASKSKSPSSLRAISNSRRRKVAPENRKRVATACNSCSVRRIRCSGDRPCTQCSRSSRACEYPEGVDKVTVPRSELEALQEKCASLERQLKANDSASAPAPASKTSNSASQPAISQNGSKQGGRLSATPASRLSTTGAPTSSPLFQRTSSLAEEVTPTVGRLLHDPDGTARYFGESSGANFLNHVKEFMVTIHPLINDRDAALPGHTFLTTVGSYQTYDSRPLQIHSVDPFWLPSRTSMTVLLTELRYFAQDGNGDFPSGGIFFWGNLPSNPPDPQRTADIHVTGQLALIQIAFALAVRLGATADWRDECPSEAFYSRARLSLASPMDIASSSPREIAVLLLMAFYLVEMNRRDAAYMTVCMALHVAVMYGAHTNCGQDESAKRVFWTLYILDCWLTCWLGRPPSISDEAIRLDLPDHAPGLPSPVGLRAHVELSRISRYIVCNLYRIAPRDESSNTTSHHIEHVLQRLHAWHETLPPELCLDYKNPGMDRACCSLHLLYNQNIILTTRPIFFAAAKKAFADRFLPEEGRPADESDSFQDAMVEQCITTARRNLSLGRNVRDLSPRWRLLHVEAHTIFNAAVIALLFQLAFPGAEEPQDAGDVQFAIDVFEQEAAVGNDFGIDCSRVLQDLRFLVHGLRAQGTLQPFLQSVPSNDLPANIGTFQPPKDGAGGGGGGGALDAQLGNEEQAALQRELQAWLDNDYFQLYNDFMI